MEDKWPNVSYKIYRIAYSECGQSLGCLKHGDAN
jgi:hypothetical protein